MDGWLCKTKRLRGFNLQLHLDAFRVYRFADKFNWVYIGLTWLIRVGECMAAAAAFFCAWLFNITLLKLFHIIVIWYICAKILLAMAKVIHVHLTHGIDGTKRKDWYFSSISAVYTVFTAEQVGATKNYLLHAGLSGNGTICTKKAIIKQSTLISCGRSGNVSGE